MARHIRAMPDLPFPPRHVRARRLSLGARLYRRWARGTDWLGARRPLDLSLGLVAFMAAAMMLAHLL